MSCWLWPEVRQLPHKREYPAEDWDRIRERLDRLEESGHRIPMLEIACPCRSPELFRQQIWKDKFNFFELQCGSYCPLFNGPILGIYEKRIYYVFKGTFDKLRYGPNLTYNVVGNIC